MPEIPVSQNGLIQHTAAGSPMSGHSLHYYGDNGMASAIGNLGNSVTGALGVAAQFKKEFDETENRLSATEARNLFVKINGELQNRMKANPGSFSEFEKWAEEADKLYAEQSKVFLDRMTDKFRKQFEADMQGMRIEALNRRREVGTQAAVSANYSRFQTLFKEAAERDPQEAMRLLTENRGSLISEQEYLTKKDIDLPRISQSAQMRREVEANTPGIIEKLSATDGNGNFTNFTAVTPEFRQSMIRYAQAKDSQKRAEELYQFAEELDSGRPISRQMIENSFAGKTSAADLKQKQAMIQMWERRESAKERATTAANAQQRKYRLDSDEFAIIDFKFSPNRDEAVKQYNDWRQKIIKNYYGDGPAVKRLLSQLEDSFAAQHSKEKSSSGEYKKSYIYQKSQEMLSEMKDDFYSRYPGREDLWYINTYNDDENLKSINFKMATVELDAFLKNNPKATEQEVRTFLDNLKRDVNQAECNRLVDFWNQRRTPSANSANLDFIERNYKGRIAIFSKEGKFVKWKDGK
ncbi:MAG: hypothetical protein IKB71_11965 [Lentisphaeria bacterium]|nr:hypothetical protein [Lentisphaeria bacterium]